MLFLPVVLCVSATIVRNDKAASDPEDVDKAASEPVDVVAEALAKPDEKKTDKPKVAEALAKPDEWCCCDNKKVTDDEQLVCLTADGHKTLLEVEDDKAADATDGYSIKVEDTIVRRCSAGPSGAAPQPCAGTACNTVSYLTFKQLDSKGTFDKTYSIPTAKWENVGYKSKYYSDEEHDRTHVAEKSTGNIYAKVEDASQHGLAKKQVKYCIKWETYAYWKAARFNANEWGCTEKKKCVRFLTIEDPCGTKNVLRGDGPEETLEHLSVGGELYELVGRQGKCETAAPKEGAWKTLKSWTGSTGAGSECPSEMFHSSWGTVSSPKIPYRFCDCDGGCK